MERSIWFPGRELVGTFISVKYEQRTLSVPTVRT